MKRCKNINCNKELVNRGTQYCNNKCQQDWQKDLKIKSWLGGENIFTMGGVSIPNFMRAYLLEEVNHKCTKCGWGEINETNGNVPLEIDHIDGDAYNNLRDNLQVLCPNCHSLTKTYKNTGNRKSTRLYRS